jgi:excisionase family DNA binding protein
VQRRDDSLRRQAPAGAEPNSGPLPGIVAGAPAADPAEADGRRNGAAGTASLDLDALVGLLSAKLAERLGRLDIDTLADAVSERLAEGQVAVVTPRYFGVREAALYAGLSEDSIRSMLSSGKLTALRPVCGRVVIDRRELDAAIQASTGRTRRRRGVYDRGANGRRQPG